MYYAYAISLMYHLKSLGSQHEHKAQLFALLKLNTAEEELLNNILEKPGFVSPADIRIIELILEPKLRKIAAEKIISDFIKDPLCSSLFSAVAFKFKELVKAKLAKEHQEIMTQIQVPEDNRSKREFNEAEIYRVPNIYAAISDYTTRLAEEIINDTEVAGKVAHLKEVDQADDIAKTQAETELLQAIDAFFQTKIVAFFKDNEGQQLNAYSARLQDSRSWGTEEALNALHGVITGNELRQSQGHWEEHTERPINFKNFKNGSPAVLYTANENPDMILDNWGNSHWVSQIPAKKDLQILLVDNPGDETIKAILARSDEIDGLLRAYLAKPLAASITADKDKSQEKRLKTSLAIATATLKEKLLAELLVQIQEREPIDLEKNYAYQQLIECKRAVEFITDDSHDQAAKIDFLKTYEEQAKSNPTGWEIFGQFIKGFLLASLSTVLGTLVGAAIGGALGSAAGPGGTLVGAVWGAFKGGNMAVLAGTGFGGFFGSALWILQMLPPVNAVQEYTAQARKAVQNSLEYRVIEEAVKKEEVEESLEHDDKGSITANVESLASSVGEVVEDNAQSDQRVQTSQTLAF
ncbi:Dot/Icm T4SS effector [Legionella donaldsonii]|uniref:Dot/Icm T4SS effector n=1 Tax=Legionella donaldsonii TaxID=45060 RepID=A0A378J7C5_9GAMM|nr:glycine zipper family protein [Legionella donaldsonii]STX42871.1 Dot/Icm T4SS effector [Legionella donaldsonii]